MSKLRWLVSSGPFSRSWGHLPSLMSVIGTESLNITFFVHWRKRGFNSSGIEQRMKDIHCFIILFIFCFMLVAKNTKNHDSYMVLVKPSWQPACQWVKYCNIFSYRLVHRCFPEWLEGPYHHPWTEAPQNIFPPPCIYKVDVLEQCLSLMTGQCPCITLSHILNLCPGHDNRLG